MTRPWIPLALFFGACTPVAVGPDEPRAPVARDAVSLPSWCSAIEAAAGQSAEFRCLNVPNFLVTGF
ncbi:MAG TPA: hypothetical protein PKA88_24970, partial [Polyangiaceae bacterium]|nr:hypothetical protein [Polyangiaceae bacterium]